MKLDLASGPTPRAGFVGVDLRGVVWKPIPDAVMYGDLFEPKWPWQSDSIDELYCSHFVEHVPDLVGFMNECHRILVPDGRITIVHPYQFSIRAWQDPTHVRALNEMSWPYYSRQWRDNNGLEHYPITADFYIESSEYVANPEWLKRASNVQELAKAARDYVNVVDDLIVVLRAIK